MRGLGFYSLGFDIDLVFLKLVLESQAVLVGV